MDCIFSNIICILHNESYDEGLLFESALRSIINLIPKKSKDIRFIKHMRPISLLNTDYKLIEKVLANRLKPMLNKLVHSDQKGFLPGRHISCNIRRILDLLDITDENDIPVVIVSVDFQKAFDRVETNSLLAAMSYFNIDQSFQKWTRVLYNKAQACVTNYGYFSNYFDVEQLVKQGGCCSAYYFLLLAEVLAIELRKNPKITGVFTNQIEKLLGQYADDLDLYLCADSKSVTEAFKVIDDFGRNSGLVINYDKTMLYRISSIRNSNARFYADKNIRWIETDGSINILGVEICYGKKCLLELNYEPTIAKSRAILKTWSARGLSLEGKILIVNTLIASMYIYKMTVLPRMTENMIKTIHKMIENFIWNGRRPKIPLHILQLNKDEGGYSLFDFNKRDTALKSSWVWTILQDPMIAECAHLQLCMTLRNEIWKCNLKSNHVIILFKDTFWREVLVSWSQLNYCESVIDQSEIAHQRIWYNSHIKINNRPFLFKKAHQAGLRQVSQLIGPQGNWLPIDKISRQFEISIMQVNQIISAIPIKWKNVLSVESYVEEPNIPSNYDLYVKHEKCVSFAYYQINMDSKYLRQAFMKWEQNVSLSTEFDIFAQAFIDLRKVTTNAKLRSFQYRLLHSAIILNDKLFRWKIKSSNNCTFCNSDKETISHFLWECKYAQNIWQWVENKCNTIDAEEICCISKTNVLFNKLHPRIDHLFNFICLTTKVYLYSARCRNCKPNCLVLDSSICKYKNYELIHAKNTNSLSKYLAKWTRTKEGTLKNGTDLIDDFVKYYIDQPC